MSKLNLSLGAVSVEVPLNNSFFVVVKMPQYHFGTEKKVK